MTDTEAQTAPEVAGLLPCPFCGHEAEIERHGNRRVSTIYQCQFCGCSLETGEEWGHGRAWNSRPAPAVSVRVTENAAERAAEIIWNDTFGARAGAWETGSNNIASDQIIATARAALTAALTGEAK